MEWNVSLGGEKNKSHRIKLPDSLPDNSVFDAVINGRNVRVRWQRATKALYILDTTKTGDAWGSIHTRSRTVARFPGESDLAVSAEFTAAGFKQTQCMEATVSLYIPGQEGREGTTTKKPKVIRSQITGKVLKVMVKVGDSVKAGDTVMIIEAMKMENRILATAAGVVESLKVNEGVMVATGAELVRFKSGE